MKEENYCLYSTNQQTSEGLSSFVSMLIQNIAYHFEVVSLKVCLEIGTFVYSIVNLKCLT